MALANHHGLTTLPAVFSRPFSSSFVYFVFAHSSTLAVHRTLVDRYPRFVDISHNEPHIRLEHFSTQTGHIMVNWLYTGTYEPYEHSPGSAPIGIPGATTAAVETDHAQNSLQTALEVYVLSRQHELNHLEDLARARIVLLGDTLNAFNIIDAVKDVYPTPVGDDHWFPTYMKSRIKAAFQDPVALLSNLNAHGGGRLWADFSDDTAITKALFCGMLEVFRDKLQALTTTTATITGHAGLYSDPAIIAAGSVTSVANQHQQPRAPQVEPSLQAGMGEPASTTDVRAATAQERDISNMWSDRVSVGEIMYLDGNPIRCHVWPDFTALSSEYDSYNSDEAYDDTHDQAPRGSSSSADLHSVNEQSSGPSDTSGHMSSIEQMLNRINRRYRGRTNLEHFDSVGDARDGADTQEKNQERPPDESVYQLATEQAVTDEHQHDQDSAGDEPGMPEHEPDSDDTDESDGDDTSIATSTPTEGVVSEHSHDKGLFWESFTSAATKRRSNESSNNYSRNTFGPSSSGPVASIQSFVRDSAIPSNTRNSLLASKAWFWPAKSANASASTSANTSVTTTANNSNNNYNNNTNNMVPKGKATTTATSHPAIAALSVVPATAPSRICRYSRVTPSPDFPTTGCAFAVASSASAASDPPPATGPPSPATPTTPNPAFITTALPPTPDPTTDTPSYPSTPSSSHLSTPRSSSPSLSHCPLSLCDLGEVDDDDVNDGRESQLTLESNQALFDFLSCLMARNSRMMGRKTSD